MNGNSPTQEQNVPVAALPSSGVTGVVPLDANDRERRILRAWAIVFVVVGMIWRVVRFAMGFPIWGDEAYLAISIFRRDFGELLTRPLEYDQIAPLGFLWLQRAVVGLFGAGEYALRLAAFLAGIATLLIFARLAWRWLEPRGAVAAIGIFAGSYALVRHSVECKPYATDAFVTIVLLWAGNRWLDQPRSIARFAALAAAAVVGVWFSYPAAFIAGGVAIASVPRLRRGGDRRTWALWSLYGALFVASFGAHYALFARAQSARAAGTWLVAYWRESFPPLEGVGAFLWWIVDVHTGRMFSYPVGGPHFASTLTTLLCVLGATWVVRNGRRPLLPLLLAPLAPALVAAMLHRYPYGGSARVTLYMAPAICCLAGAGVGWLLDRPWRERPREVARGAVGLAMLLLPIGGAALDVLRPYKLVEYERARDVMREVAREIRAGDGLLIVNPRQGSSHRPEGPVFHQSLRYYLEYYTGVAPRWLESGPAAADVKWVLTFSVDGVGPAPDIVDQAVASAGLRLLERKRYRLSERFDCTVTAMRCGP